MTSSRPAPTPDLALDATTDHKPVLPGTAAQPRSARRFGRVEAWIGSALRDVVYCAGVLAWSIVAFTILITGAALTASLLFLVVGVFVWVGFVHVMRWTTWVDRRLAGWQRHEAVPAAYRRPIDRGSVPYLRTLSADPQTWKDMAWLALTSLIGFVGGLVVITAAGLATTYVSLPLWYWAPSPPDQEYGLTNLGFLTVDTLREAGIAAGIGLVLIAVVMLLARCSAAAHAALAVRMLASRSIDP